MSTRYFPDLKASLRHLQDLIDTAIEELKAVGWRKTPKGYVVDHDYEDQPLRLPGPGTQGTDWEPPRPGADDPTAGPGPEDPRPGEPDDSDTAGSDDQEPDPPGTPTRPPAGPPAPLPLAYVDETPVRLRVIPESQDFTRDVMFAQLVDDPTGRLDRRVTLEVGGLPDAQWQVLSHTGRLKDSIEVTVLLVIGRNDRPMSGRVRVVAVTGDPPPTQGSLFA